MRSALPAFAAAALLLSACHANVDFDDADSNQAENVHFAMKQEKGGDRVSVKLPGFSADVSLPSLNMGGNMDMDGIKLAPDTDVKSMDVTGTDKDADGDKDGIVRMAFANPRTPAALLDYYRKAAADAGFDAIAANATSLTAHKGGKQFALAVTPDGAGSRGTITMRGSDE